MPKGFCGGKKSWNVGEEVCGTRGSVRLGGLRWNRVNLGAGGLRMRGHAVTLGGVRWRPPGWGHEVSWRSHHGRAPQHLLSVCFSVFCGGGLELAGILLHPGELVRDGLNGGRLLICWLYNNRGLQTGGPGSGLVLDLWRVRLVVGCVRRRGDLVALVGCLAAPASVATSARLGDGGDRVGVRLVRLVPFGEGRDSCRPTAVGGSLRSCCNGPAPR